MTETIFVHDVCIAYDLKWLCERLGEARGQELGLDMISLTLASSFYNTISTTVLLDILSLLELS